MYDRFRVAKLLSHKSLWKEWTSFTIQDVRRVLPRNFVHCFQRQFHIRLGYETLSFLFLEQCFQLSLSDEIGGTFFDIDNFSIIPKYIFFDIDNLPIIWKMPIYRLSIIFFDNIAHPYLRANFCLQPLRIAVFLVKGDIAASGKSTLAIIVQRCNL